MNKLRQYFSKLLQDVSLQDKINFARHLSIVISAGLPLLEGLKIIRRQTTSRSLGKIIEKVAVDVSNGQFLAASLAQFPAAFDDFFVNIVRVGEASGTLSANLSYLSDELRKSRELKNKIKAAVVYPTVVLVATVSIVGFLVFFVFPKVIPLFASLNVPLPTTTKVLISVAQFILTYWIWILVGFAVFVILARILLSLRDIKYAADRTLFFLPVVSRLIINVNMANLSRVLGILLKGGIKIVEAVTITAATFDNSVYRRALLEAAEEVKRGEPLARYLEERDNIFPLMLSGLVEIGENTGNLEDNLFYLSDYFQEEVDFALKNLTSLLEPALLLVMGLVVGFVAISIITPIYQITQGVH